MKASSAAKQPQFLIVTYGLAGSRACSMRGLNLRTFIIPKATAGHAKFLVAAFSDVVNHVTDQLLSLAEEWTGQKPLQIRDVTSGVDVAYFCIGLGHGDVHRTGQTVKRDVLKFFRFCRKHRLSDYRYCPMPHRTQDPEAATQSFLKKVK